MTNNKFKIFGNVTLRDFYIVSQEESIELHEYFILEDENSSTPVEVVEVFTSPMCVQGMTPVEVSDKYISMLGLKEDEPTIFAKVKILNLLSKPIRAKEVRKATFEDIKHILITSPDIEKSMVLGNIVGTESVYQMTPNEYKDIAPMFENGQISKQKNVPFMINPSKQQEYPHTGFFGGSGSGKSYALKDYCEELMNQRIPALVLDPHHEMDFNNSCDGMNVDYSNKNEVFNIGELAGEIGIKFTELNINELCMLFEFMDGLSEPQRASLEAIYTKGMSSVALEDNLAKIKDIVSVKETTKHPDGFKAYLSNLAQENRDLFDLYINNRNKISNVASLQALSWKLSKLLKTKIFNSSGVKKVESALLQSKLAIIRGNVRDMQMVSSYLINKVYSKRRAYQDSVNRETTIKNNNVDFFPMFCIVVDEAHNFAPNGNDLKMSPTKSVLKTIAQEARKYGVFEVMCTQRIGLLDPTIVAQMNTKFIFRTTNASDMEIIKKECNLSEEELLLLPDFPSGYCIVTSPTLPKNFNIKFRAGYTKTPHRLDCFEELRNYNEKTIDSIDLAMEKYILTYLKNNKCLDIRSYTTVISELEEQLKKEVTVDFLLSFLNNLDNIGKITKQKSPMGVIYKSID